MVRDEEKSENDKVESSENTVASVKPLPPFPQRLEKLKEETCYQKFIDLLKQVHINLLLVDVLQGV